MQWTHIDDLAEAIVLAGTHPAAASRTYNITGGELFTQRDVDRAIEVAQASWPWPAVLGPLSTSLKYDIARVRRELGYEPQIGLADGIAALALAGRSGWS